MSLPQTFEGNRIIPIDELNKGLREFKKLVCEDKDTKDILDVAIVRFDKDYGVIQPFEPVARMINVNLSATGGDTIYSPAIGKAIEMVQAQRQSYNVKPFKPWIVYITDGAPNTSDASGISRVAQNIQTLRAQGKLRFISLGVQGYKPEPLQPLSDYVIDLGGWNFMEFFSWLRKSMAAVSQSVPGEDHQEPDMTGKMGIVQSPEQHKAFLEWKKMQQ
jgi:uncharacterized protein YegL